MLFSLLNNLKDIVCGNVRKIVMLSITFRTISSKLYRQIVGILMGTKCALLVADLFLCLFLFDFILYIPSTIFQLCRDGSSWVKPVLS